MVPKELELKKADSRGRLILGRKYKDKYVTVLEMDEATIIIIIPVFRYVEKLWKNVNERLEGIEIEGDKLKALMDKTRQEVYKEIYG